MRRITTAVAALFGLAAIASTGAHARTAPPIVKAVFFYSPECAHCHKVIAEDMPGISERFGSQLLVVYVDVSAAQGSEYFNDAMDYFTIPSDERAVPALVVGNKLLVGEVDIPGQLPIITEAALASGGLDWPAVPGLSEIGTQAEAMATQEAANPSSATGAAREASPGSFTAEPGAAASARSPGGITAPGATASALSSAGVASPVTGTNQAIERRIDDLLATVPEQTKTAADLSLAERLARDRVGFGIAIVVLIGLAVSVLYVGIKWFWFGLGGRPASGWRGWVIPLLALVGLVVAAYLAYIETSHTEAFCGPVGDCNAVQQSPYAMLFGVLPVGVLGVVGYVLILALWALQRFGPAGLATRVDFLLPSVAMFGALFSAYLTFLEVFVISAVCIWCIASAVIMGLLLWAIYLGWASAPGAGTVPAGA